MKKKLRLSVLLLTLFMITQHPITGLASELNFSVESIIPDNQRDKSKTYFDLRIEPNTEQTIELNLRNDTPNDVTIEPQVNSATTNLNGVVEYGQIKEKADKSLPLNLSEIVTVEKEVTIPAKQSIKLPLKIKMPDKKFDGILAGGITIKEKDSTNKEKESKEEGLAITNKYAYVIALLINQTDTEVIPNMVLNSVAPNQVNARNVINATLQNDQSAYINNLKIEAKITKKNKKETLYKNTQDQMQMAPNSSFNYPISLNGEKLQAGKYTVTLHATAAEGKWDFSKDFTISSEDAKKYNKKDVSIKEDNTWIYILIGIVLVLLIFITVMLLIRNKKKKEAARKRRAASRKRKAKKEQQKK